MGNFYNFDNQLMHGYADMVLLMWQYGLAWDAYLDRKRKSEENFSLIHICVSTEIYKDLRTC